MRILGEGRRKDIASIDIFFKQHHVGFDVVGFQQIAGVPVTMLPLRATVRVRDAEFGERIKRLCCNF
jgi:hypothetical protein